MQLVFFIVGISGVVLLFLPSGRYVQMINYFIFPKYTWDMIDTWSGIGMFISTFLHFISVGVGSQKYQNV